MAFSGNNIKSNFTNNKISTDFQNNIIGDDFQNNNINDKTNLKKTAKKERKSLLEVLSWIIAIIVGLIAFYEFVLKHWF